MKRTGRYRTHWRTEERWPSPLDISQRGPVCACPVCTLPAQPGQAYCRLCDGQTCTPPAPG